MPRHEGRYSLWHFSVNVPDMSSLIRHITRHFAPTCPKHSFCTWIIAVLWLFIYLFVYSLCLLYISYNNALCVDPCRIWMCLLLTHLHSGFTVLYIDNNKDTIFMHPSIYMRCMHFIDWKPLFTWCPNMLPDICYPIWDPRLLSDMGSPAAVNPTFTI